MKYKQIQWLNGGFGRGFDTIWNIQNKYHGYNTLNLFSISYLVSNTKRISCLSNFEFLKRSRFLGFAFNLNFIKTNNK